MTQMTDRSKTLKKIIADLARSGENEVARDRIETLGEQADEDGAEPGGAWTDAYWAALRICDEIYHPSIAWLEHLAADASTLGLAPEVYGELIRLAADATKGDVVRWDTVSTYIATFAREDGEGACDVEVQVGEAGGVWWIRTRDDAGGDDAAPDIAYASVAAARQAAEDFAAEADEGCGCDSAREYLAWRRQSDDAS